jgi:hypothetical protein
VSFAGLGIATADDFRAAVSGLSDDVVATRDLRVYLSRNSMKDVPASLVLWLSHSGASSITHLDLSCNLLASVPAELFQLKVCHEAFSSLLLHNVLSSDWTARS